MTDWWRIPLQVVAYAGFGIMVVYFSIAPPYQHAAPGEAQIKVSLSHAAERVRPCVRLTPEQIQELAANMRRTEECGRQRLPLALRLELDDATVLDIEATPSGLWEDGPASVYERFRVAPGQHRLTVRLRDSARSEGWDYVHSEHVTLKPGRYLTVTFRKETGGFTFR